MARQDVFAACRSGVAQISLERGRDRLTAGSGFLVQGGIITSSHVLHDVPFDIAVIRFEDMDYGEGIRLAPEDCAAAVVCESPPDDHDVVYLRLDEPEFEGRHVFSFEGSESLRVGDEIGFLGYPFQMQQLTCHVGHVSSLHRLRTVNVIQIDGSVNGGNSGGPMVELSEGRVVGIVTRAEIGFLADQFDELIRALTQNVELLQNRGKSSISVRGIDPVQGLLVSQVAMLNIARNLRRSANVGIGYAFSSNYIRDRIAESEARYA